MAKELDSCGSSRLGLRCRPNVVRRIYFSVLNSMLGGAIGGMVFTWGLGIFVVLLDVASPLGPMGSYGQFEFVIFILGAFGIVGGVTCGLIPFIGKVFWAILYAIVMLLFYWLIIGDEFLGIIGVAYLMSCLFFAILACLCSSFLTFFLRS